MRGLAEHAARNGQQITLEMYEDTYVRTCDKVVKFLEEVGHDACGLNPDIAHLICLHLALSRLQQEGKIRLIGLSNITVKQLEEARTIAQIVSVQNRYSVAERQGDPMVDYCAREGLAFVPYGPLGADPMKHGAPLASTQGTLADIGKQLGATATQVALSWLLYHAPNILPIPGTTSIVHLEENMAAAKLRLTQNQLQQLESVAGRSN